MSPIQTTQAAWATVVALCLLILSTASASDLEAGFSWLVEQQGPDGAFHTEPTVTTSYQTTAEVLAAARMHGVRLPGVEAARAYLASPTDRNSEYLARSVLAGKSDALRRLPERAGRDGGIGDGMGHGGSVLATAYTLLAWAAAGDPETELASAAVGYLLDRQRPDGGWADGPNPSSDYLTALVSRALQAYRFRFQVGGAIDAATAFLDSRQGGNGGWGADWETAWVLLAVIPARGDTDRYAAALTRLNAAQLSNGSWGSDVFATALALQALAAAARVADMEPPVDPDSALLVGRILVAGVDSPLAGALVGLPDNPQWATRSDSNGRFELELPAGEALAVHYGAEGFQGAVQTVTLSAGSVNDVGHVWLSPLPEHGRLAGSVTSAVSGAPLAGAELRLTGATELSLGVGLDGGYELALPAGAYSVTATAAGHHPASASFELFAGTALRFSPVLIPVSEPPIDDDAPAGVIGTVVDAHSGEPLAGAVLVGNGISGQSDADGAFDIEGLAAGSYQLGVSRDGYRQAMVSFTLQPGIVGDLGELPLQPADEPTVSRLVGIVRDSDSGLPVPGALAEIGGKRATTDIDGRFVIDGLADERFTLRLSATGFHDREYQIRIEAPGTLQLEAHLEPLRRGGIELPEFRAAHDTYGAWAEVPLTAKVSYDGPGEQVVRLYLRVYGPTGDLLHEHPAMPVFAEDQHHHHHHEHHHDHDHELSAAPITIASGELAEALFSWFTEIHPPGDYRLELRAYQAFDGELLGARSFPLRIRPTQELELVSVRPEPLYLTQGSVSEVGFRLVVQHRSNITVPFHAAFSLEDPDGVRLHTDQVQFELDPAVPGVEYRLEGLLLEAKLAGEYPMGLLDTGGGQPAVSHAQSLHVAPGTRVEVRQNRTPGTVAPDGDHRIEIEIRLEGKEQ